MNEHRQNYLAHDLEFATIIHELNIWRHYLTAKKFLLNTNNMSLEYLFDHPYLNSRKAKWLSFLNEYHFELNNIKGKVNKIVDALRVDAQ